MAVSDIERPIWQRVVVNAHVLAFRDIYLELGGERLHRRAAKEGEDGIAPEAPHNDAQRALLRLLRMLPRSLFGESAEQRLTYARVLAAVKRAGTDAAALEQLAAAAAAVAREEDQGGTFQTALSTAEPEDGEALRAWCDGFEARSEGAAAAASETSEVREAHT